MINVLVATHGSLADGLKDSVKFLMGDYSNFYCLNFNDSDVETFKRKILAIVETPSDANQWIILCDILGGTPFKIASEISYKNEHVCVYYGVNLPLILQALLSRKDKSLNELTEVLNEMLSECIGVSSI